MWELLLIILTLWQRIEPHTSRFWTHILGVLAGWGSGRAWWPHGQCSIRCRWPMASHRHIRDCHPSKYGNVTHEAWPSNTSTASPVAATRTFVSYIHPEVAVRAQGHQQQRQPGGADHTVLGHRAARNEQVAPLAQALPCHPYEPQHCCCKPTGPCTSALPPQRSKPAWRLQVWLTQRDVSFDSLELVCL